MGVGIGVDMGIAQWSYGGFSRFRRLLAAEEGIDLDRMAGFGLPADEATPWNTVTTPLHPLLDHSDCDGELSPEECAQVAPRLKEICEAWSEDDDPPIAYDRSAGLALVAEMNKAVAEGRPLVFR